MKGVWVYDEKLLMVIAINLFSICCVYKEKIVKNDSTEERSVHTNSESCNFRPYRKNINLI